MAGPEISIIVPAYEEGEHVVDGLRRIANAVDCHKEVLMIVDSPDDSSVMFVEELTKEDQTIKILVNTLGRGPANAIKFGIANSKASIVVVTMADGCDDPSQIKVLADLVRRGVVVAAASRYAPGGQQIGGPRVKRMLSKFAGRTFALFTGVGTKDATNSFKGYSRKFIERVGIDSTDGFEIGLELTAKAKRLNLPVAEVPSTWIDRTFGESQFKVLKWIPAYLGWYFYGLGFPHPSKPIRSAIKQRTHS